MTEATAQAFDYTEDNSREINLKGHTFRVLNRFAPGDVLDEKTANFANTAMVDFVRGSFYAKLDGLLDEGPQDGETEDAFISRIQSVWNAHDYNYEWTPRGSGGPALSPREKMIAKIGKEWLQAAISAKGKTLRGVDPETVAAAVAKIVNDRREEIEKEADRRLAQIADTPEVDFDFPDLKANAA